MDAPVGKDAVGWRIRDNSEASDGKAPGAHWFGDRLESRVVADKAPRVAVHVDGQRAGKQLPSVEPRLGSGWLLSPNGGRSKTGDRQRGRCRRREEAAPG